MNFEVDFGAPQTGIGYRFQDMSGNFIGSRVTTGIIPGPVPGTYFVDNVTPPAGALFIYWDCDNPLFTASESIVTPGPPGPPAGIAFQKPQFGIRTSNFLTDFLYGVAAVLSINPDKPEFSDEFVRQWTSFLNTRLSDTWDVFEIPEFFVTEERAFRTVWRNDQNYFSGDEVYFVTDTNYYIANFEVPMGIDPSNATYWTLETTIDKYIGLDQLGQRPIGEMRGVFNFNPRLQPYLNARPSLPFRPSEKGIDVWPRTGSTVFVNYKMVVPKFTTTDWESGTVYNYGDTVFYEVDGNCYQCGVRQTTAIPTDISQWFVVPFPTFLLDYLIRSVAGDAADDIQTEATLLQEAETILSGKLGKLSAQGFKSHYRSGRHRYYRDGWCCGLPWTGGFVSTLTNAFYSPLSQDRRPSLITEAENPIVTETGQQIVVP